MATQDLFGTTRTVPDDGATNWGSDVRGILVDLMKAVDKLAQMTTADQPFLVLDGKTEEIATGATLSVTNNRHDIQGTDGSGGGAAVTLAGLTEVTGDGHALKDGQTLLLVGTHDTHTVEMDSDDGAGSWVLNGDMILGLNDAIYLMWDSTATKWIELSRNN